MPLLQQENKTLWCHQATISGAPLPQQWMPDQLYGSGTAPRDRISRERRAFKVSQVCTALILTSLWKLNHAFYWCYSQATPESFSRLNFYLWRYIYFSQSNLTLSYKWALPSAMRPNRSPSRSRESRRSPSSHFHHEQHESEQQQNPPPPKMPLSRWISEDGIKSEIPGSNTKISLIT